MNFKFDNSYFKLPKIFYKEIPLNPVKAPELIILNESLATSLNLDVTEINSEAGIKILSGSSKANDGAYIAQAYGGHQFGHFTMLGDGRAVLIGEILSVNGERYDIQLKGSGRTPYSRGGDGRAVIGPMLREYIISEGMYQLGIPTSRSLAVVKTGEEVIREEVTEGAILTRISASHIRFGTFEYAARFGSISDVKALADYSIDRHYTNIKADKYKYINFLKEVMKRQINLVAQWQGIGFIHGVMNTDNMMISGETIDYGPCAFMDIYNPNRVFSSIDREGRYSYKNQPQIIKWNLCRLAETLLPLISEDQHESVKIANDIIGGFGEIYYSKWMKIMRSKLGIFNEDLQDKALIGDLLAMMEKYEEDYTNTFISLTFNKNIDKGMFISDDFKYWYNLWKDRLTRQEQSIEDSFKLMKNSNPAVIPRNNRVEEALKAAENENYKVMTELLHILNKPYKHSKEQHNYSSNLENIDRCYKTYCGT